MENVTYIKTGEIGSRIINLKKEFNYDFIILDQNRTRYLEDKMKEYCDKITPKIIHHINKYKTKISNINFKANIDNNKLLTLFLYMYIDIIFEEIVYKINDSYNKTNFYNRKWSITGYTNINNNYIFRNNISKVESSSSSLFIYSNENIENFDEKDIPILNLNEYTQCAYMISDIFDLLEYDIVFNIIYELERYIDKTLKYQVGFIIQNYIPFLRYIILNNCIKDRFINEIYSKVSFSIVF